MLGIISAARIVYVAVAALTTERTKGSVPGLQTLEARSALARRISSTYCEPRCLSAIDQIAAWDERTVPTRAFPLKVETVELDGDDGIVVTVYDGTTGAYVAEELKALSFASSLRDGLV